MKKIKNIVNVIISIAVIIGVLSGCSSTKSNSEKSKSSEKVKTIYVATQNDYPPFNYVDSSGKLTGYDVEVIKEINKHLPQYKFEFVAGPWASVVPSLEANKTQIIADEMTTTPEREKKFIFSESYFSTSTGIVVKKGRNDINSLEDLKGHVVEVSSGDAKTTYLEQWNASNGNAIKFKYTENSQPDIFQDIAAGRADATINDVVMTNSIIKKSNLPLQISGKTFRQTNQMFVLNKDTTGKELKSAIDPVIKQLKTDGTLKKLAQKWTGIEYIPQ